MKTTKTVLIALLGLMFLLTFCHAIATAQKVQVGVHYLQGVKYQNTWDLYKGGTELSAMYVHNKNGFNYKGGLDFRTVQWGTQATFSMGVDKVIAQNMELGVHMQNGAALFRSNSLYVFASGITFSYLPLVRDKVSLGISLGWRFSICPSYKDFSTIYKVNELPLGVFVRF